MFELAKVGYERCDTIKGFLFKLYNDRVDLAKNSLIVVDEAGMVINWDNASIELPQCKAVLNMRVDKEVLDYFRKTGRGYQSRINAVLRSYVEQKAPGLQKKIARG